VAGDVYEALPRRLDLACPNCRHSALRLEFVARESDRVGYGYFWGDFCLFGIRISRTSVPVGVDFHLIGAPHEELDRVVPRLHRRLPPLEDEQDGVDYVDFWPPWSPQQAATRAAVEEPGRAPDRSP
jgi:hypothetical protein